MMLYLMRHGIAEARSPQIEDRERKLTARSGQKIREVAAGMRALKVGLDLILTSPFPRAAETAEIVAAEFGNAATPEPLPKLRPETEPAEMLSALSGTVKDKRALIVGHEPALSHLASLLLTGSTDTMRIRLKQGGCIALEMEEGLRRGGAQLRWMLTQRQLRKLGR